MCKYRNQATASTYLCAPSDTWSVTFSIQTSSLPIVGTPGECHSRGGPNGNKPSIRRAASSIISFDRRSHANLSHGMHGFRLLVRLRLCPPSISRLQQDDRSRGATGHLAIAAASASRPERYPIRSSRVIDVVGHQVSLSPSPRASSS